MSYNMETGAPESVISLPLASRVINCDINEDLTLPEGYPDVRRVLALRENLLSPTKFIGARSVDISGAVDYTVIYSGVDGNIYGAPFSAEYGFSMPIENAEKLDLGESVEVLCSLLSDSGSVRISSPRRLQIRSSVKANVSCFGRSTVCEDLRGARDQETLYRRQEESPCVFLRCESSDVVMLSDEYIIGADARIIYSSGEVLVNDARVDGEVVRISGEAVVRLLVEENGKCERVIRKLPFDAESDLDELELYEGDVLCRATGSINELEVSVEDGRANIEAGVVLEVCVAQNASAYFVKDIFSTKQVCTAEYKKMSLPILLFNKNSNITQSERMPCNDIGLPENAEILDVFGNAECEECSLEKGRYTLRGKTKYKIIYKCDGEVGVCDAIIPFKQESKGGELCVDGYSASICVSNPRARSDRENLLIESELSISAIAYGSSEVDMLASASFGDEIKQEKNQFIVCFASENESAFDLAKRYSVPLEQISERFADGNFVVIER